MALRFNPPPNWPAPPEGFNPPAGWQPDPAWGPAPEGWQLWVEDSATSPGSGSAPQAASAPDAGWAPTQAVSTGSSPVADPTGQSASAPAGDYSATSAPIGTSAPVVGSASSSAPYSGGDYAQAPTPYHSAPLGGGQVPPTGTWQGGAPVPGPGGPGGSKPLTQQWWLWAIITGVAVIIIIAIVALLAGGGGSESSSGSRTTTRSTTSTEAPAPSEESSEEPSAAPGEQEPSSSSDRGYSESNPADPATDILTFKASEYSTDPNASIEVSFGEINWNGGESLKQALASAGYESLYTEPPAGKVYLRVLVEVTYHGTGQFSSYDLSVDYVNGGNSVEAEYSMSPDEFKEQDMPRDGGKAQGYITFLVDENLANSGAFAVTAFYGSTEMYMSAK